MAPRPPAALQASLFEDGAAALGSIEAWAKRRGLELLLGVDEAGRGPLAGPVVAAAVSLPDDLQLPGLDDSKRLSPARRETLLPAILDGALAVGLADAGADRIDEINILEATREAMAGALTRAVASLRRRPDMVLIDGHLPVPGLGDLPQHSFVKGDRRSRNIAAASIVAKVVRDFLMLGFHEVYPQYGFDSHKGYGTRAHLEALSRHGPSPIHRRTFAGVPGPPMPDDRIGRRR